MSVVALKRVATLRAGGTPSVADREYWSEDGLPWVTIGDMTVSPVVTQTNRRVSAAGVRAARLELGRPGTLLFAMYASLGEVAFLGISAAWNQAIVAIDPRADLADSRFIRYALLAMRPTFSALARSNTQDNLNAEQVGNLQIPALPLEVQRAIADFLDNEIVGIDLLIAKRQEMRVLLSARIASFHEQWFSDLARRYTAVPLRRFLATLEQGWSPVCEAAVAEPSEWGVLKTSAVSSGRFIATENKRLPDDQPPHPRWRVSDGDLLMTRGSGSRTAVGQVAVASTDGRKLMISDLVYRLRLNRGEPEFMGEVLRSPQVRSLIEQAVRTDAGQTLKIRGDDIRGLPVPSVPTESQASATRELHAFRSAPSRALDTSGRQVALLRERRQALIAAAVTGEIDVSSASGRGVPT